MVEYLRQRLGVKGKACMQVALQAGTVRVHCAGTAVNGCLPRETSAVTFVPCIPAGKPGILFQVGLGMIDADMPLPPHLRAPRVPEKLEGPAVSLHASNLPSELTAKGAHNPKFLFSLAFATVENVGLWCCRGG